MTQTAEKKDDARRSLKLKDVETLRRAKAEAALAGETLTAYLEAAIRAAVERSRAAREEPR